MCVLTGNRVICIVINYTVTSYREQRSNDSQKAGVCVLHDINVVCE